LLFVHNFLEDQAVLGASPAKEDPLVSVILPTYSRLAGGFLERAISSVLSQTFKNFELLVMDDGSHDGSYELIENFRASDPRVIHVRHERNCGLPALRVNEGIELSRGQYLAFQFDDDHWRPDALHALVGEALRHSGPAVFVGRCQCEGAFERVLPPIELDLVNLYQQNLLANNSVLFPRSLVQQYGMYDCHIGMRRLCDWDLWLRYIKHVPFITIDHIVADAFEHNPGSIAMTVPWDLSLFRFFHGIPREQFLTLEKWREYEVDSLRVGEVEINKGFRRRLYEDQIVPYYLKFRHNFPQVEGFPSFLQIDSGSKTILYTKSSYDVTNDVTVGHYDKLANRRCHYKLHYEPISQVRSDWVANCDLLLLMRTVEDQAKDLLNQAIEQEIPAGLYLDDDLLTFSEIGHQYNYLAPGTANYQNLEEIIGHVDTVWTTNAFIAASVKKYNPRHIPHNNSIQDAWLPSRIISRDFNRPVRIGYIGSGGYRIEEFKLIWDALQQISNEYGESINFEFWGLDIGSLPKLHSPVKQVPFTFSYFEYIHRLQRAEFDIILTPLLAHPRPRLGKSLIKYYETAVAGALGIFSNVPQYKQLPSGLTCLKAENTSVAWCDALRTALTMPQQKYDQMRERLVAHVREEFTEKAQIYLHEAAIRATEFHAKTRAFRYEDGRPRILFFLHSPYLGGGEIQLWRRLRLARRYGIEPIVVLPKNFYETEEGKHISKTLARENIQLKFAEYKCFTEPRRPADYRSDIERKDIEELIECLKPALVHTVTFIPSIGQICVEKNIPHVASLYQVDDAFAWANGHPDFIHASLIHSDSIRYAKRWSNLLNVEKVCTWGVVPEEVFDFGRTAYLDGLGKDSNNQSERRRMRLVVFGTLQERKRQLETIEAIGLLCREGWDCQLDLFGYTDFFPEYLEKCQQRIRDYGLENRVNFCGFNSDVVTILQSADAVLSLSIFESFPGAIAEAMAGGVLVVATPVGGIPELIIDGVSGVLCDGISDEAIADGIRRALSLTPSERKRIVEQARRVARSEFHPHRVACDMLTMYNRAIDLTRIAASIDAQAFSRPPAPETAAQLCLVESPPYPPASHLLINGKIKYSLNPQHPNWVGFDVLVGTHQRVASGKMNLLVFSDKGYLLREISVDLARARDNDWLEFRFPPIANADCVPFTLEFSINNSGEQTRISFYESNPREGTVRRLLRRGGMRLGGNKLYCRTWYGK
jgi:glycosyltransferase involved in cell wall biosynthesis